MAVLPFLFVDEDPLIPAAYTLTVSITEVGAVLSPLEPSSALGLLATQQAFSKPAFSHIGRITGLSPAEIGDTDSRQVFVTYLVD